MYGVFLEVKDTLHYYTIIYVIFFLRSHVNVTYKTVNK